MAYEYINVRMSRSNKDINWGFTLRQGTGNQLVVASVERDSMAEKAGISPSDMVQELFGNTNINLNDAQNRIQNSNELTMILKRWVANPPALPWSLDEKGNQVFVSHYDQQGKFMGRSDQKSDSYMNSFVSNRIVDPMTRSVPIGYGSGARPFQDTTNITSMPNANTVRSESRSQWDTQEGNMKKHYESQRTYSKTESTNVIPSSAGSNLTNWTTNWDSAAGAPERTTGQFVSAGNWGATNGTQQGGQWGATGKGGQGFGSDFSSGGQYNAYNSIGVGGYGGGGFGRQRYSSEGQYGRGGQEYGIGDQYGSRGQYEIGQSGQYGSGSQYGRQPQFDERYGGTMYAPYGETIGPYRERGSSREQYPRGRSEQRDYHRARQYVPRVIYHSPQPRTYRELSPTARIKHLQYNSPIGMYSPETMAEEYRRHTGKDLPIDPDYPGTRPVWMDSATRRAIEEEERGIRTYSPVPQSSSFKRISNAVGTPVH